MKTMRIEHENKLTREVKREIARLCDQSTDEFAHLLNISWDTAHYIIRMLDYVSVHKEVEV